MFSIECGWGFWSVDYRHVHLQLDLGVWGIQQD